MSYDVATSLALSRLAIGIGTWFAPRASLAVTRLDPSAPQSPYLVRLFAAREAALGVVTLLAVEQRPSLLKLGLVVDSLDAAAGVLAARSQPGARILTGVAAGSVAVGTVALMRTRGS
jgi:hypothetical protein